MQFDLEYYIKEVLTDMGYFGIEGKCNVFIDRATESFLDYTIDEGEREPLYIDEKKYTSTLFELLVLLFKIKMGDNYAPAAVMCQAVRRMSNLSQSKFSAFMGFSVRNLQNWEIGFRVPSYENLLNLAKKNNISYNLFFGTLDNLISHKM